MTETKQTETPPVHKSVFEAIIGVMGDLGKEGIAKDRNNQQQGYKFRGIDDVYNALSPVLSRHGLCMLPRILTREVTERTTQKGNALFYVTVEAEFDLILASTGQKHTVRTYGEAMDSADKATNKAMSAAYKYAAMQTFAIPTEGDNDADATTNEVKSAAQAKRDGDWEGLKAEIDAQQSSEQFEIFVASQPFLEAAKVLPASWRKELRDYVAEARTAWKKFNEGREIAAAEKAPPYDLKDRLTRSVELGKQEQNKPFPGDIELTHAQKIARTP